MVIGLYSATFLASFCILITLLVRQQRTINIAILFSFLTTIQSFGRLLIAITTNFEVAWLGNIFVNIGGCFCPLVIIIVLSKLCKIKLPKWILIFTTVFTIFVFILSTTSRFSDIYYSDFYIVQGKTFNYLEKEYGPAHILFPIMILIDFLITIFCFIFALKKYKKVSLRTIKPIAILTAVILISYILERVFDTKVSYLSIGYFIAMIFCVYFFTHLNMFDMTSNIMACVEKRMDNGYIQFDNKFRCAGYNEKIVELFPEVENKWTVDEKIPEDDSFLYKEVISWFLNHKNDEKKTIQVGNNFYEMSVTKIIQGKRKCVGYVLELFDRTAENIYLEAVKKYNSNLKKEVFQQEKEIDQINDVFGKVVDPYVRDHLMKGNDTLGGETRDISVMFCDIRSFTAMSEGMDPAQVVSMLNFYFTALGKCITKNHGIINKYIGDAIMAIFGAPEHSENHALDAYNAAMDMREALKKVNKKFAEKGWPEVRFGIGIHSGPALAGNIGATSRMEYTVIGDTVNTASRIEGLCKEYKTDLLITESTAERLDSAIKAGLTFVDDAKVRGKEELVKLYK